MNLGGLSTMESTPDHGGTPKSSHVEGVEHSCIETTMVTTGDPP